MALDRNTPVGTKEIAEHLGVERNTVGQWQKRGLLPPAPWVVHGWPCWRLGDILDWHKEREHRLSGRT